MQALKLCPNAKGFYIKAFEMSAELLNSNGIVDHRFEHFLAQIFHESGGLTVVRESMSYRSPRIMEIFGVGRHSAAITAEEAQSLASNPEGLAERVYGLGNPRKVKELGNTQPGDGFRFRGNGLIQTTGRGAHRRYGLRMGVDLEACPELLTDPQYALQPAIYEWLDGGCNEMADRDDIKAITRKINGGYNGLDDRLNWLKKIRASSSNRINTMIEKASVLEVQRFLNLHGFTLAEDGISGPKTMAAKETYERTTGRSVEDGIRLGRFQSPVTSINGG